MEHEAPHNGIQWIHLTHIVFSGVGFNNTLQSVDIPYNKIPDN
jgi:hypothetical protein